MGSVYRNLISSTSHTIYYINDTFLYPSPAFSNTSILGPIFSSGLYGKNLTNIEIGSSGGINLSLFDSYTLDITKNEARETIFLGRDQYPISIQANDSYNTIILGGLKTYTREGNQHIDVDKMIFSNDVVVQNTLYISSLSSFGSSISIENTINLPHVARLTVTDKQIGFGGSAKINLIGDGRTTQSLNARDDSYWEFSGGHMRISSDNIEYGFRINNMGELEIFKVVNDVISVVTKFGGIFVA